MALPLLENGEPKPLEVKADPLKLTVGEIRLMKGHIRFDESNPESSTNVLVMIAEFLIHHTNWTEDEVNQIAAIELAEVLEMVRSGERAASVPLANSVASANGQEATLQDFPNGPATSPTPSNSHATPKMLADSSMPNGTNVG